jgi:hypothetical protein
MKKLEAVKIVVPKGHFFVVPHFSYAAEFNPEYGGIRLH